MQDFLTWGAIITAGGSLVAWVSFFINRGKAEAEVKAIAEAAASKATAAIAKCDELAAQIANTRFEFARDYASNKDLAAAEVRYAGEVSELRVELRGIRERLDRIIERLPPKE